MDSPESGVNLDGAQLGDMNVKQAANEITNNGTSVDDLFQFVKEYVFLFNEITDVYRAEQRERIRQIQIELWLYRIVIATLILYVVLQR